MSGNDQQNSSGSFWKYALAATFGIVGAAGLYLHKSQEQTQKEKKMSSDWAPSNIEVEKCVICQSKCDGSTRILDCGHVFHAACIIPYVQQSHKCPVCRYPVESLSRRWSHPLGHTLTHDVES